MSLEEHSGINGKWEIWDWRGGIGK